jgi:dienelactone hydrolase
MIETLEIINKDIPAAVEWLKKQPDVKTNQIAMAGVYSGGVQAILAGREEIGVRCFVSFFPGVTTWKESLVFQGVMSGAIRRLNEPLFLVFVKNNQDLDPADVLGEDLRKKGKPNRTKVYPAFGKPNDFGRKFVTEGTQIWGPDVLSFLDETMKGP